MQDWHLIATAPKDGTLIQGLDTSTGYSFFRCFWKNGEWREMAYKGIEHPTFWRHNLPEHRIIPIEGRTPNWRA
jgi:hypothetical protein